jgi:hypothetical protein
VGVLVQVQVEDTLAVGVQEAVVVKEGVAVDEKTGLGVQEGVLVGVAVDEAVADVEAVAETVGDTVAVGVVEGVIVKVLVAVQVGVDVTVRVRVAVGAQGDSLTISTPVNSALSLLAVSTISITPPVTETGKVWSSAVKAPTSATISKLETRVTPLMAMLNTRLPIVV